jgi:proteasome accessory factor C
MPGGQHNDLIDIQFWPEDEDTDDLFSMPGKVLATGRIHVIDPQGITRPMKLTRDQALGLIIGLESLRAVPELVDREVVEGLIEKLQDLVGQSQPNPVVVVAGEQVDETIEAAVIEALSTKCALHLHYLVPSRDEITQRTVDPHDLLQVGGKSYLRAWCREAGDMRTFRLSRIQRATVLSEPAQLVSELSVEPATASEALLADPDIPEVTLALAPAARWIADYAAVVESDVMADGRLRVRVRAADPRWAKRIVLQAAGAAEVLQPADLAAAVRTEAAAALALYG